MLEIALSITPKSYVTNSVSDVFIFNCVFLIISLSCSVKSERPEAPSPEKNVSSL